MLAPVFVHVMLVIALVIATGRGRVAAVRAGEVRLKDVALEGSRWPERLRKLANNYQNQFELPVLFYALCGFLAITQLTSVLLLACAWGYVFLRAAHTFVHLTSNKVIRRFQLFFASSIVLYVMWALFLVRLLTA